MTTNVSAFDLSPMNDQAPPPYTEIQAKENFGSQPAILRVQAQDVDLIVDQRGSNGGKNPSFQHSGSSGEVQASATMHTAFVPFQAAGFPKETPVAANWLIVDPSADRLNLLDDVRKVTVERVVDMMEAVITNHPMALKRQFRVLNERNQQILFLDEDEVNLMDGIQRAFHFWAKNCHGQTVFQVSRESESCAGCFCCACMTECRSEAKISDSRSGFIGLVQQRPSFDRARFVLLNRENAEIMDITGEEALLEPNCHYEFQMRNDGQRGAFDKIGSNWGTALNKYILTFPSSADARTKACCLGVLVLFDFRFHLILRGRR